MTPSSRVRNCLKSPRPMSHLLGRAGVPRRRLCQIICSGVFITGPDPVFAAENVGYFTAPYGDHTKMGKPIIARAAVPAQVLAGAARTVLSKMRQDLFSIRLDLTHDFFRRTSRPKHEFHATCFNKIMQPRDAFFWRTDDTASGHFFRRHVESA